MDAWNDFLEVLGLREPDETEEEHSHTHDEHDHSHDHEEHGEEDV